MNTIACWIGLATCALSPLAVLMLSPYLLGEAIAFLSAQKSALDAYHAVFTVARAEARCAMRLPVGVRRDGTA